MKTAIQYNARHQFALGTEGPAHGRIFIRPNTGKPGEWKPLGLTGLPWGRFIFCAGRIRFREIYCDNDFLVAVTGKDKVWRIKNALEPDPAKFIWMRQYGVPMGWGSQLSIPDHIWNLRPSEASSVSTVYYTDPDGNRHERFIAHIYALSEHDNYIHFNDPWTPSDWEYVFPMPEQNRFVPARKGLPGMIAGMAASASVVGVIGPKTVYTIEFDFDIAGGNPLSHYSPSPQPPYPEIVPLFGKSSAVCPTRLPPRGWARQPPIPGLHTANLSITAKCDGNGRIVPGSDSRILRVVGIGPQGRGGYWEKELKDSEWRFAEDPAFSSSLVASYLIQDAKPENAPPTLNDYKEVGPRSQNRPPAELKGFGPYDHYFDPAVLSLPFQDSIVNLKLYMRYQFRFFSHQGKNVQAGYILVDDSFRAAVKKTGEGYPSLGDLSGKDNFDVLIVMTRNRVAIFRRRILFNFALFNIFSTRLARPLFVFERC